MLLIIAKKTYTNEIGRHGAHVSYNLTSIAEKHVIYWLELCVIWHFGHRIVGNEMNCAAVQKTECWSSHGSCCLLYSILDSWGQLIYYLRPAWWGATENDDDDEGESYGLRVKHRWGKGRSFNKRRWKTGNDEEMEFLASFSAMMHIPKPMHLCIYAWNVLGYIGLSMNYTYIRYVKAHVQESRETYKTIINSSRLIRKLIFKIKLDNLSKHYPVLLSHWVLLLR